MKSIFLDAMLRMGQVDAAKLCVASVLHAPQIVLGVAREFFNSAASSDDAAFRIGGEWFVQALLN